MVCHEDLQFVCYNSMACPHSFMSGQGEKQADLKSGSRSRLFPCIFLDFGPRSLTQLTEPRAGKGLLESALVEHHISLLILFRID